MRLKLHRINLQASGFVVKGSNQVSNLSSMLLDDAEKGNRGGGIGKLKRGTSGLGGFSVLL
jgi:hypothetical protein